MSRLQVLLSLLLCCILYGCGKVDPDHGNINNEPQDLNVLVIGNSYGPDAFSYVPFIFENVCPGYTFKLWILFIGNSTIDRHLENLSEDRKAYQLFFYNTGDKSWRSRSEVSSREALTEIKWDMVVTHQISSRSGDYSGMAASLNKFVNEIRTLSDARIAWLQVPCLPDDRPTYYDRMYDDICGTCKKVVEETAVEYVIPCGTAIQSARGTDLISLGNYGQLTEDGVHLQEGLPCLLEAFTCAEFLFRFIGEPYSVMDCSINVNNKWLKEKGIPRQNGYVVGIDGRNVERAKQMAVNAVNNPYIIEPVE